MYKYSKKSLSVRDTLDSRLVKILDILIQTYDHSVIWGYRNEEDQNEAFKKGNSKKKYPHSKHNSFLSKAMDIVPYPGYYKAGDKQFYYMAGLVKGIAKSHNIKIRWGGDWDGDNDFKDQSLNDLAHFELIY